MSLELSLEYIGLIILNECTAPSTALDDPVAAEVDSRPMPKKVNMLTATIDRIKNPIAVVFNLCQLSLLKGNILLSVDLRFVNIIDI
jgi:hypothetical protein